MYNEYILINIKEYLFIDSNIFYKYYKREVEIEYHPNIEERIKVLKDDTPWGIIYYIKHAITIIKWRLNKKGWNGR